MKEIIFELYIDEVCRLFNIDRKTLFTKETGRIIAHARQFLFWLCHKRGMMGTEIVKHSSPYIHLHLSTVLYGVRTIAKKAESDSDLLRLERKIRESVSIL